MRIALFPVYSSRFVPASPSYNWCRSFVENVTDFHAEATFYLILPSPQPGSGWEYPGLFEIDWPRTHPIYVPMYRSQFDELALATRDLWELFNERHGDLWFDVMISERPMLAPLLKKLCAFHIVGKSRRPTILNRAQIVMRPDWFKLAQHEPLMEAIGYVTAPTAFQSEHQLKEAMTTSAQYLRPSQLRTARDQAVVMPLGIDCADVDRINLAERDERPERITVNFSHKLFLEQRFIESLTIMDSVLAGGRDVGLQIVTGSAEAKLTMLRKARRFRYMDVHGRCNREEFLRLIARAHICVSHSPWEDFSATLVEMMWSGLIPVLPDLPWARYLVPAGYPYLFDGQEQAHVVLRHVVDEYEAIRDEWVPNIQAKIEDQFDLAKISLDLYDWAWEQRHRDLQAARITPSLFELIDDVWKWLPDEFSIETIVEGVKACSNGLDISRESESHSTSKWLFVDGLIRRRYHGKVIDLGGVVPSWRKREGAS